MKKNKWHFIGCLLYSTWVIGLDKLFLGYSFKFPLELLAVITQIWIFYTSFLFLFFLFLRKKILLSISIILICFLGTFFLIECYSFINNLFYDKPYNSFFQNLYRSTQYFTQIFIYSLGYFFAIRYIKKLEETNFLKNEKIELHKKNSKLKEGNTQILKEKLQAELNFLRAQINPHFLQNCLNFVYSDIRKTNKDAADAVMLLSNIMRYSVADNTAMGGMALLADEITQVESVIKIHQLRFQQKLQIHFSTQGNFSNKQIVPMILLTLVENLIKYGDLNNSLHPAQIDCNINENEKKVYFTTSNKKTFSVETISTGLGLKNIRERLSLIWQDNFTLEKEEVDDWYKVKLSMPFIDNKATSQLNYTKTPKHQTKQI